MGFGFLDILGMVKMAETFKDLPEMITYRKQEIPVTYRKLPGKITNRRQKIPETYRNLPGRITNRRYKRSNRDFRHYRINSYYLYVYIYTFVNMYSNCNSFIFGLYFQLL